jgi:hypothetical protein
MRTKSFIFGLVVLTALASMSCSSGGNPASAELPGTTSTGAVFSGTVSVSGAGVTFGAVQIGLRGSTQQTTPNSSGEFALNDLPVGNQVVEVSVKNVVSDIPLVNVQSGEEIRVRLEIRSNCQAVVANMERNRKSQGELMMELQPKKWNLDWTENEEWIKARVSGDGYDTIVPSSVKLVGPQGDELDMVDTEYELGGTYFKASFKKMDALGLIQDPVPGMSYPIKLVVDYTDAAGLPVLGHELPDEIEIVGKYPKDSEDLSLQVNPAAWNTNWDKSSGTVMVKFWGEGFDDIAADSVRLVGPEPDKLTTNAPVSFNLTDDQLIVKFSKQEAIALFPDPQPGDTYIIKVTGDFSGAGTFTFDYAVKIVGPKK